MYQPSLPKQVIRPRNGAGTIVSRRTGPPGPSGSTDHLVALDHRSGLWPGKQGAAFRLNQGGGRLQ
jgi:hypothetical protein